MITDSGSGIQDVGRNYVILVEKNVCREEYISWMFLLAIWSVEYQRKMRLQFRGHFPPLNSVNKDEDYKTTVVRVVAMLPKWLGLIY